MALIAIRCVAVRDRLRAFLHSCEGQPCQIVSLGAGFDTSFFVLADAMGNNVRYVEVDFPHVLENKRVIIEHTPELQALLGGPLAPRRGALVVETPRYVCVGSDLSKVGDLRNHLVVDAGVSYELPTLVLAECVLTYMSSQDSDRVIHWVRSSFQRATWVCYEQVRPNDAFGGVMRANLDARGSSLLGVHTYPTLEAQEKRYRDLGFADVSVCTIGDVWRALPAEERTRIEELEVFDEHEEWDEKCEHYVLAVALTAGKFEAPPVPRSPATLAPEAGVTGVTQVETQKTGGRLADCKVWGHTVVPFGGTSLVVFGGYGGAHRHERVNNVVVINCVRAVAEVAKIHGSVPVGRVQHGACMLGDGKRMVIHGGRASPSSALSDVRVLHCGKWEWESVGVADAPARFRHSLTCVGDSGAVVVGFGGKSDWRKGAVCSDAWVLHVDRKRIDPLVFVDGVQPEARASHAALWFEGALYIYGGFNAAGRVLSDVWRITFVDDSFTKARAEKTALVAPPRYSHSGSVCNGVMYFVGGCSSSNCNTVVAIDPSKSSVVITSTSQELPSRVQCASLGNRLFLVGGGMTCFSFGSTFADTLLSITLGEKWIRPDPPAVVAAAAVAPPKAIPVSQRRIVIPIINAPTAEQFHELVSTIREPRIFSSCGVPLWSRGDILASVAPETQASIHVCEGPLLDFTNKNYQFEVVRFDTMLDRIDDAKEHLYFRSLGANARKDPSNVSDSFPGLFMVPPFASSLVTPATLHSSCLRFSSADIQMWTHYDINDNILCGMRGRKRLLLWAPEEVRHLYADGTASLVLDVDNPDLERFPKFAKAVVWEGVLEEGQALFIPAMWWHNVRTLSPSYGLNLFFRHLAPDMYQSSDLYGNRDLVPAQKAHKSMQAALEQLAELPEPYRRFFLTKLILEMKRSLH